MSVAGNSGSSLHLEQSDFKWLVSNKMFHLALFNCIHYPLTTKYTSEKFIAEETFFKF